MSTLANGILKTRSCLAMITQKMKLSATKGGIQTTEANVKNLQLRKVATGKDSQHAPEHKEESEFIRLLLSHAYKPRVSTVHNSKPKQRRSLLSKIIAETNHQ